MSGDNQKTSVKALFFSTIQYTTQCEKMSNMQLNQKPILKVGNSTILLVANWYQHSVILI